MRPNLDMMHGPDNRAFKRSGVFMDRVHFNLQTLNLLEIPSPKTASVIRTCLIEGEDKPAARAGERRTAYDDCGIALGCRGACLSVGRRVRNISAMSASNGDRHMHATADNATAYQDHADAHDVENERRARTMLRKATYVASYITANHRSDVPTILEVGCGTVLFTKLLAGYFRRARITASDAFAPMLDIARERLGALSNITMVQYDAETAGPFAEPFDFVCGVDLIHHLNRPVQAMRCWRKIVKSSGRIVFFESNARNPVLRLRMLNRPEIQIQYARQFDRLVERGRMVRRHGGISTTLSSERPAILMADDQPNRDGGSQADRAAPDRRRHDRFGESLLIGLSGRDRNFAN